MHKESFRCPPHKIDAPQWDSRKVRRELNDGGLLDSIREIGIIQTPCVWSGGILGGCQSACGWRRIVCASHLFLIERDERFAEIEVTMLVGATPRQIEAINLTENVQRDSLHSWELCLAYYELKERRMREANPSERMSEDEAIKWLSSSTGQTEKHIKTLIRIRERLIPELWALLVKFGLTASVGWNVLHDIAMLRDRDAQIAEWQKRIDPSTCAVRRGKERKPGNKKLERYLTQIKSVPRSPEFRRGLREGIRVALGEKPWQEIINPDANWDKE